MASSGAYVCAHCQLSLPAQERNRCPVCDAQLVWHTDRDVPKEWREAVDEARQILRDPDRALTDWRLGVFLGLGVDVDQAEQLAERRDVDYHRLAALLRRGCPVDLAVKIVA